MANRWLKYLAVGLLAVFCLAFARTDTTEKSMVRAVLLEPGQENWTVGLLYQAPDASADSSEVSDGIRFAAAQGPDLERALANAEAALPLTANFRLCDYLLLLPGSGLTTLEEYEALVLARQCGRTGARMAACGFTCAELSEATEEGGEPLTELLQALKQTRRALPFLYEARVDGGVLLPVLALEEGRPAVLEEGVFLSGTEQARWDAEKTAVYRLLTGRGEQFVFWLGERPLTLRRPLLSIEAEGEGFALRLDCQTAADSDEPTPEQLARLGQLCTGLLQERWAAGQDLLGLGACRELWTGVGLDPAKNACPQLRTDVAIY